MSDPVAKIEEWLRRDDLNLCPEAAELLRKAADAQRRGTRVSPVITEPPEVVVVTEYCGRCGIRLVKGTRSVVHATWRGVNNPLCKPCGEMVHQWNLRVEPKGSHPMFDCDRLRNEREEGKRKRKPRTPLREP